MTTMEPGTDYISSTYVLNKIPRLTKRQLDYWATAGYVASYKPKPGSGRTRWFSKREFPVIVHMDVLVNQLHIAPDLAMVIACTAKDNLNVSEKNGRKYTWVTNDHGVIIGLPVVEEPA